MIGHKPPLTEIHLIIKGVVQGVFFRATTKKHANDLKIKGCVRNLNDGSVEICITHGDVEELIKRLKNEPLPIQIKSIVKTIRSQRKVYQTFTIA